MYKKQIEDFVATNQEEKANKEAILEYIDILKDEVLNRSSKLAHITSSGFIMNEKLTKTLMIHHNIYNSWGWTGGHADGDKDLLEIAKKEALEETGIEKIDELTKEIIAIDIVPVPPHMKKGKYINVHLHLNITYLLIASEDEVLIVKEDENSGVKWIDVNDLEIEVTEKEMLPIYNKIIKKARSYKK